MSARYRLATGAPCPDEGADACRNAACRYSLPGVELYGAEGEPLPVSTCALAFADAHPDGATLEAVGDELGVTREYVRQVEERALERLVRGLRLIGAKPSPEWKELLAKAGVDATKAGLVASKRAARVREVRELLAMPAVRRRLAVLRRCA